MRISASLLALALLLAVALACNLAERLGGDDQSVMVTSLWPDVPPFPGATKTDVKLPLPMRIVFSKMMKGKMSFITFRTDKSAQEVKDFYSGNSMTGAGWARDDESCFRDTENMQTGGSLCNFTKAQPKKEGLGIMVQGESSGATIFYIRIDMTEETRQ
ncbi:MAG TPA: hypothetical protein VF290_28430 [Pyrinomonadaceae bacterium]